MMTKTDRDNLLGPASFPYPEPATPTGTDIANDSFDKGRSAAANSYMSKQEQKMQDLAQRQQLAQEIVNLQRGLLGGLNDNQGFGNSEEMRAGETLLGYKNAWEQANAYADKLNGKIANASSDDERTKLMQELDNTNAYMGEVAKLANDTRSYYDKQGLNLSRYGSDVSSQEAALNYTEDYNRGIKNILNNRMTPDDVYEEQYQSYRAKGYTREQARQRAGKMAARYQADMLARYQDGIRDYGYSADGSYNDYALQILGMMKNYDPELANMMLGANAGPKDAWSIAQGRENAAIAHEYDKDKMGYGNQLQQGNMMLGNKLGMDMAKLQHILGLEKMGAQYGYRLKMDDANYANTVSRLYNAFIADGMSESEAKRNAVLYASGIKGGKTDKVSPQEAKMNVALQQLFSGKGSIEEYEKDIAGLILYMDDETKQYMTSDVKYLYNAVKQWQLYPTLAEGSDTRRYLEYIKNNERLVDEFERLTGTKFPL